MDISLHTAAKIWNIAENCSNLVSCDFGDPTLTEVRILNFRDIIGHKGWKDIFWVQTFHFFQKKLILSVSHQYTRFYVKNALFLPKRPKFRGKQTNSKKILENRQSGCFFLTKIFFGNIRPIEKKLEHFLWPVATEGGKNAPLFSENPTPPFIAFWWLL